ncbi:translesion DNA synthesis-associated protein ImuA [Catenovulum sp. SX2]|uniref:translesion DNA synthesis-associated protein ImuA n=1 Tax=Catenovulum sp. SX2 TaxID=3398614 RepID=UPI003F877884
MQNLIELLEHKNLVWHGYNHKTKPDAISSGYAELDEKLCGGFAKSSVIELISETAIGELRLLIPSINQTEGLVVFIAPPGRVNGQTLQKNNFDINKVIIVQTNNTQESLWAAEQCLQSGCCHSVCMWISSELAIHQIKRLKLACKKGDSRQFVIRRKKAESITLPFDLSLSIEPDFLGLNIKINKFVGGHLTKHFNLDMSHLWPNLAIQTNRQNIIQFPTTKVS